MKGNTGEKLQTRAPTGPRLRREGRGCRVGGEQAVAKDRRKVAAEGGRRAQLLEEKRRRRRGAQKGGRAAGMNVELPGERREHRRRLLCSSCRNGIKPVIRNACTATTHLISASRSGRPYF